MGLKLGRKDENGKIDEDCNIIIDEGKILIIAEEGEFKTLNSELTNYKRLMLILKHSIELDMHETEILQFAINNLTLEEQKELFAECKTLKAPFYILQRIDLDMEEHVTKNKIIFAGNCVEIAFGTFPGQILSKTLTKAQMATIRNNKAEFINNVVAKSLLFKNDA